MGVYINEIIKRLNKIQYEIVIIFGPSVDNAYLDNLLLNLKSRGLKIDLLQLPIHRIIIEQIFLPIFLFFNKGSFLICSGNSSPILCPSSKLIPLIHDVYFLKKLNEIGINDFGIKRIFGRIYRRLCILKFKNLSEQKIITVSEFAKKDIVKELMVNPNNVFVIPNGVDLQIFKSSKRKKRAGTIMVSGKDPQKNLSFVISNICKVNSKTKSLIFPLKIYGVSEADNFEKIKGVYYMGYFDHSRLAKEYRKFNFFIIPSLYESFGIPAIEALASDCKVISSNTGALPEVLGNKALYFNPKDSESFIKAIENLKQEDNLSENNVLETYTWDNTSEKFSIFLNNNLF